MELIDLENKDTFRGIEHDVIIWFFDKAEEYYNQNKTN